MQLGSLWTRWMNVWRNWGNVNGVQTVECGRLSKQVLSSISFTIKLLHTSTVCTQRLRESVFLMSKHAFYFEIMIFNENIACMKQGEIKLRFSVFSILVPLKNLSTSTFFLTVIKFLSPCWWIFFITTFLSLWSLTWPYVQDYVCLLIFICVSKRWSVGLAGSNNC